MSTDISIKAKETFLTIPEVNGSNLGTRSLSVTKDFWYAQIFLAKTTQLPKIFFMAKLSDLGSDALNEANNLKIQLYSVNYNSVTQKFTINSPVGDAFTYPYSSLQAGTLTDGDSLDSSILWYQVTLETAIDLTNTDIGATGGNTYYAFVFSSQVEEEATAPKIYYSLDYRQSVFPFIFASNITDGVPDAWSNNIVPTVSSGANTKAGAIIFGYVGNELGSGLSEFEAGTITLGSGISSRRGYGTYIHVENSSTQTSGANSLSIGFSQLANSSIASGLPEETDASMMKWYFYQPASLPRTTNSTLFSAEDAEPVLDQTTNFVLYYQPDRLPPYPKVFSKESDVTLTHNSLPINVIYQYTEDSNKILIEEESISDVSDNFNLANFAHFRKKFVESPGENPDYIDFTLEDTEEELKELVEIRLTNSDAIKIRGFSNVVRFRDRYIAFAQYETESDGWYYNSAPTGRTGSPFRAYVCKSDDIETWNSANIYLEYAVDSEISNVPSSQTDVLDWYDFDSETGERTGNAPSVRNSRIVGVFDTTVQRAWDSTNEEYKTTLFVLFQVFPSHLDETNIPTDSPSKPFFALGWLQDQPDAEANDNLTFKIIPVEDFDENDARFDPVRDIWGNLMKDSWVGPTTFPRVGVDYKSSFFISPDSNGNLYLTARNPAPAYYNFGGTRTSGKFGLWSLDLETDLSDKQSLSLVRTSGTPSSGDFYDFRGFNRDALNEIEISYVLRDGNKTYFGTCTYDYEPNSLDFNSTGNNTGYAFDYGYTATGSVGNAYGYSKFGSSLMGEVYVTSDFVNFNQILSGSTDTNKPGQEWLIGNVDGVDGGVDYTSCISFLESGNSYAFPHVVNDRVAFMAKVYNILHIWLSPSVHSLSGTPFHIAHDLSNNTTTSKRTKLIRKFPITDIDGDSDYTGVNHDGTSDAQSNLASNTRSKWMRKIISGIRNGNSIFLVGTEGQGEEYKRFTISTVEEYLSTYWKITTTGSLEPLRDGVTEGLHTDTTKYFEDFTSTPHFAWITGTDVSRYNSGPFRIVEVAEDELILEVDTGTQILGDLATGSGGEVVITKDHYEPGTMGLRWLIYDDRTINRLYEEIVDSVYSNTFGYAFSSRYSYISGDEQAPWGYYTGVSTTTIPSLANPIEKQYYPALTVSSRTAADVGLVHEVDTFEFSNDKILSEFNNKLFLNYIGLYDTGSIVDDIYNINPRLVNQKGITYLICDNGFYSEFDEERVGKGYRVYKTYGQKQEAENWGSIAKLDFEIFNESLQGQRDFSGLADQVRVSQSGNITFVTSIKEDKFTDSLNEVGRNYVNLQEKERYIYAINNGLSLPQIFSYFYKIYSTASPYTVDVTANMILKWANSREELYRTGNSLSMNIGQVGTDYVTDFFDMPIFTHTFPTDLESGYYRLESYNIPNTSEVLVKGLRFHSIDLGGAEKKTVSGSEINLKAVSITGIVKSDEVTSGSSSIKTTPEQILDQGGGCLLSPGGYVVINFPKPIYINQISFDAIYDSSVSGNEDFSEIEVSTLSAFDSQLKGAGVVVDSDWKEIDGSPFILEDQVSGENQAKFDSIRRYIRAIRIKLSRLSGVSVKLFNLEVKTLAEGSTDIITSSGVTNANLMLVDDTIGLLRTDLTNRARAFATFNKSDSYVIFDLGAPTDGLGGFPVNRITINAAGADSTRKMAVDVWDGVTGSSSDPTWENVYNGKVINYRHYFGTWTPETKAKSTKVEFVNDTDPSDLNINSYLTDTDFFTFSDIDFNSGNLQNYSFRPNVYRDDSLTIVGSSVEGNNKYISVNMQMDADGPFGLDMNEIGLIERNLNINFPLRQVKRIRVRMTNAGRDRVRMNGLKVYTPLIQPEDIYSDPDNPKPSEITRFKGDPIWPRDQVTWQVRFSATATGI